MTPLQKELRKRNKLIIKDIKNNISREVILSKYNITYAVLYNMCRKENVIFPKVKKRIDKFLVLADLFNNNLSENDIAVKHGTTVYRVNRIYNTAIKAGIPGLPER
jgi:hypothetical protein